MPINFTVEGSCCILTNSRGNERFATRVLFDQMRDVMSHIGDCHHCPAIGLSRLSLEFISSYHGQLGNRSATGVDRLIFSFFFSFFFFFATAGVLLFQSNLP